MYVDFTEDTLSIIGNKVFLPCKNAFDCTTTTSRSKTIGFGTRMFYSGDSEI